MPRWQKILLPVLVIACLIAFVDLLLITDREPDDSAPTRVPEQGSVQGEGDTTRGSSIEPVAEQMDLEAPPGLVTSDRESESHGQHPAVPDVTVREPSGTAVSPESVGVESPTSRPLAREDSSDTGQAGGRSPLPPQPTTSPRGRAEPATGGSAQANYAGSTTPPAPQRTGAPASAGESKAITEEAEDLARQESTGASSSEATPRSKPADEPVEDDLPAAPAFVRMVLPDGEIAVGDVVPLTIMIAGAENVGHTPFYVRFNPSVLQFEQGEEGWFLRKDGQPTAFFASPMSDGATVVVGLSRLGPVPGVDGDGQLCVLHFRVVGVGDAGLVFARAQVKDSSNRSIPSQFSPALMIIR